MGPFIVTGEGMFGWRHWTWMNRENISFYTDDFEANENVTWQLRAARHREQIFSVFCVVANDERISPLRPSPNGTCCDERTCVKIQMTSFGVAFMHRRLIWIYCFEHNTVTAFTFPIFPFGHRRRRRAQIFPKIWRRSNTLQLNVNQCFYFSLAKWNVMKNNVAAAATAKLRLWFH